MSAVWSRNIVEPNLKQISATFSGLLGGSISPKHTPIIAVFLCFFCGGPVAISEKYFGDLKL